MHYCIFSFAVEEKRDGYAKTKMKIEVDLDEQEDT